MGNKYEEEVRLQLLDNATKALADAERAERNFDAHPNKITLGQLEFKVGWLKHTIVQLNKNEETFPSEG